MVPSVGSENKGLALGLMWVIIKAFGNCWAPIVAGKIMDMSCVIWSTTECGQGGSCHVYKDDTFVAGMLALREFSLILRG